MYFLIEFIITLQIFSKLEITQNQNGNKAAIPLSYTLPLKVRIVRIDKVVYYSINDSELTLLQEKLRLIDRSSTIRAEIELLKDKRKTYVDDIRRAIAGRSHAEINKIFNQIVTEVTDTNAIISIKQNVDSNVEFAADYQTTAHITTSEADGTSYKKLLCVAFDLALLISYSSHSFYKFVYHDGVLEGLDDRVKQRLITTTQRICSEYGLQYILSLIDSDIPQNIEAPNLEFPMDTICLDLNDIDDSGKLFMRSF